MPLVERRVALLVGPEHPAVGGRAGAVRPGRPPLDEELGPRERGVALRGLAGLEVDLRHDEAERVGLRRVGDRGLGRPARGRLHGDPAPVEGVAGGRYVLAHPVGARGELRRGAPAVPVGDDGVHEVLHRLVAVDAELRAGERVGGVAVRGEGAEGLLRHLDAAERGHAEGERLVGARRRRVDARAPALGARRAGVHPVLRRVVDPLDLRGEPVGHRLAGVVRVEVLRAVHDRPDGVARGLPAPPHVRPALGVVEHVVEHRGPRAPRAHDVAHRGRRHVGLHAVGLLPVELVPVLGAERHRLSIALGERRPGERAEQLPEREAERQHGGERPPRRAGARHAARRARGGPRGAA